MEHVCTQHTSYLLGKYGASTEPAGRGGHQETFSGFQVVSSFGLWPPWEDERTADKALNWLMVLAFNMIYILITVIGVEYMVVMNNVTGVNNLLTAGQLLAFIVGIGGFLVAGLLYVTEERHKWYGEPWYEEWTAPD